MQRYGDFWLIPRNRADSSSTCCDELGDMRHSKLMHDFCVAKYGTHWCLTPLCHKKISIVRFLFPIILYLCTHYNIN